MQVVEDPIRCERCWAPTIRRTQPKALALIELWDLNHHQEVGATAGAFDQRAHPADVSF
jgi:hypothetical protein